MADKVTVMVLKVDLHCGTCCKKVKKLLCKYPQIRDQVYDDKQNTVTITVLDCCPERIRDKLCSKGGKTIKSIDIKQPQKTKEPEKPKPADKTKDSEKPKAADKPKEPEKPKAPEKPKVVAKAPEKPKEPEKSKVEPGNSKPSGEKPAKEAPKPAKPKNPAALATKASESLLMNMYEPVHGYPPMTVYPVAVSFGPYYEGYGGGPCYNGYGELMPPPSNTSHDGYGYGYESGYSYSGSKDSLISTDLFSEENPQACTIM